MSGRAYPIRVGFGNEGAPFDFSFTHSDAGGPGIAWTRDRMRARTSELGGVSRTVYGQEVLGGGLALPGNQEAPPVPHFDQRDLVTSDFSALQLRPPQGAPTDDNHIPDHGGQNNDATATMNVAGFIGAGGAAGPAEVVDSIELIYEIDAPHWDQLKVDLEAPGTGAGPGARAPTRSRAPRRGPRR